MVMVILVIVAVLAIAGVRVVSMQKRRERDAVQAPFPLIYPISSSRPAARPSLRRMQPPEQPSQVHEVVTQDRAARVTRPWEGALAAASGGEPETSSTVRFRRPADEAVELLPGRLEVLAGEQGHKEIRLVRAPGEAPAVVLGRDLGDSPGHVALHSTTVSRRHARLAYQNGEWSVTNLSQTNPVVVNEEALLVGNGERPLADGDCLELGEVVLRFHAR